MLTYEQAAARILSQVRRLEPASIALLDSGGLVASQDVIVPHDLPPFTNSAMDGYAICSADTLAASSISPILLPIDDQIAAGRSTVPFLARGRSMEITTGAPLPIGADSVVPKENAARNRDTIELIEPIAPNSFVRHSGEDFRMGDVIFEADTIIRAAEVAAAAASGLSAISAYPHPRVGIITTGDELVELGIPLNPGQIYDSNRYMLSSQVTEAGGAITQSVHAIDTKSGLRTAIDVCSGCDIIISAGGVSVGAFDLVRDVLSDTGTIDFWQVAIRPGKPFAFGTIGNSLFFGLPGNPVSAFVTFELFVRPVILSMRGLIDVSRQLVQAYLTEPIGHEPGRRSYQRGIATHDNGRYSVRPVVDQGSHQLKSLLLSNSLIIVPDNISELIAGDIVSAIILN